MGVVCPTEWAVCRWVVWMAKVAWTAKAAWTAKDAWTAKVVWMAKVAWMAKVWTLEVKTWEAKARVKTVKTRAKVKTLAKEKTVKTLAKGKTSAKERTAVMGRIDIGVVFSSSLCSVHERGIFVASQCQPFTVECLADC